MIKSDKRERKKGAVELVRFTKLYFFPVRKKNIYIFKMYCLLQNWERILSLLIPRKQIKCRTNLLAKTFGG